MARIPIAQPDGTLGGVIARPQQAVSQDPRAFGAGIAAEGERLAARGVAEAEAELARQQADQRRQQLQEEAERKAREREARRVQSIATQARVVNDLADLEETIGAGLADGSVDKTSAVELWRARSGEILKGGLEGVDAEHRPLVEASLLDNMGRAQRSVRRLLAAKDRQDIAQGAAAHLEEMQRYAARGDAQADEAIRNVEAFLPSVAAQAGIDAQRTVQGFRERVRFRQAADLVQANPVEALKVLRDKDRFPELDPDKRASLIAHADAAVLRAQERARIEAERIAREQERVFQGAAAVFESGRAFSVEYGDRVLERLKGSPYEASVREMIRTGPQNVAAATLPIPQQRAQLDELMARANTQGTSDALNAEIARRQKVLDASTKDAKDDPLGAALERGVITAVAPLNVADLQSLPAALAQRQQAARTAQQWSGQPVSPLRPQEAEQLSQSLAALPPEQKASALATIGAALNDRDQITALARQIDAKDKQLATAMMYATTKTSAGRYVSEIILRGQQAQRDGKVKEDRARETGWRAAIATEIGNAYPNEELRNRMVDAAYAVQVGLAAEGDADVSRAVRLATGGVMTQADDSKVPLPYGWTERELRDGLRSYPAGKLPQQMRAGPATLTREQLVEQLPNALLVHAGQGRYAIRAGSGFITDEAGRRVVLDFSGSAQ